MGQTKFGEASGWNAMKDKAVSQTKESPGGKMFFGGLGKGLATGALTRNQNDSKGFAGEEEGQIQAKGKKPRFAGLFGGFLGRARGKKRFGLF
tara:strand:+ start:299 stop:577 length:279 start_codon:yes stop_codon:yes gene_type:complete